jgi:steroid 5-alpha reductase family enzyme
VDLKAWIVGLVSVLLVLGISAGFAWAGSTHSVSYAGWPVFLLCGLFAYAVQWVVFLHAWIYKTERFFDLTGSITFCLVIVGAFVMSDATDVRSYTLMALIVAWAVRLGPFLYSRIKQAGEDRRFRSIRTSFPTFFRTWTLQGAWVFITSSCALAAITSPAEVPLGAPFVLGVALWFFGFCVEIVADRQKSAFRAKPENARSFISTGLWAWSRHPNYFGEIVLWLGVAVIAYPELQGWQYVTLISPLFVVVLLTFISGMRMLEYRANKTWGDDPDYQAYKSRTPGLIMWPPRSGQ